MITMGSKVKEGIETPELILQYDEFVPAISNGQRIVGLFMLSNGASMKEIADALHMPRSSYQRFVQSYFRAGIIKKTAKGEYELTQFGKSVLSCLIELRDASTKSKVERSLRKLEQDLTELKGHEDELGKYKSTFLTADTLRKLVRALDSSEAKEEK
jgi:Mn-dependent DtxR family transcriptional regulator